MNPKTAFANRTARLVIEAKTPVWTSEAKVAQVKPKGNTSK